MPRTRAAVLEFLGARLRERGVSRFAQHAVHDEVGIPAYGRREVRVVLRGEAEVAEARGVVARFLHRPQHERRDRTLLRCALDSVDQLLEVLWLDGMPPASKAVASVDEGPDSSTFQIGRLVNAKQRRQRLDRWCDGSFARSMNSSRAVRTLRRGDGLDMTIFER